MAKKKRFQDIWVNQTTLGRQFNRHCALQIVLQVDYKR